jgi:hypothetical protein
MVRPISVNGIKVNLGIFDTAEAAHEAYLSAAADKADGTFWAKHPPRKKVARSLATPGCAVVAVR